MLEEKDVDRIAIHDLKPEMSIGIYDFEKSKRQPVLVTIVLDVASNKNKEIKDIGDLVSYEDIVRQVQDLSGSRHYDFVEVFAEEIADLCLKNTKVNACYAKVLKTEILKDCNAVGVEIRRTNKN